MNYLSLESVNCCLLCANIFSSPSYIPISYRCGHTFCSTCVQNNNHYKTYGGKEGLCVVDRTQVIKGVEGRINKCLFGYLNLLNKQLQQNAEIIKTIQQSDEINKQLNDKIQKIENRITKAYPQISQLQYKLESLRERQDNSQQKQRQRQKKEKQQQQQKQMYQKYQKLKKINEVKLARLEQLRYQARKLRAEGKNKSRVI